MSEAPTPAPLTPSSPTEALEPFIAARLRPLHAYAPGEAAPRSDFDLNPHSPRPAPEARALTPAAVLVGLVEREAGLTVLLTRRSDSLRSHSGQVAFPGGRMDPGESPADAALRESWEEVGLDHRYVRLVGLGDAYETGTGFSITPVVGFIRPGFTLQAYDAEVAEIFETPFAFLMDQANHELRSMTGADGVERRYYALEHDGRIVWGATAGVIRALYDRLFGANALSSRP
jgi:8-oxo-dGTP pyrophosphatase MutT (NUDIX family)